MRGGRLHTLAMGAVPTLSLLMFGCSSPRIGSLGPTPIPPSPPAEVRDPAVAPAGTASQPAIAARAEADRAAAEARPADPGAASLQTKPSKVAEIIPTGAMTAARVGSEVITQAELDRATRRWIRSNVPTGQQVPPDAIPQIQANLLNSLVERNLIVQDAKRKIKDEKKWSTFTEMADQKWKEEELEPLLRKYKAKTVHELSTALTEDGDSLAEIRADYRSETVSRDYIRMSLGPKLRIDLPEMRSYYEKHKDEASYRRTAQIVWREIAIDTKKAGSKAAAEQKAGELLARLQRGEDFAALARKESDGVTAKDGGLWKTSPGALASKTINEAIESQPLGRLGGLVESRDGFSIILVESRTPAGTLSFSEVQDQIRNAIFQAKLKDETTRFLGKLRAETPVTTRFDKTDSEVKTASDREP